MPPTVSRQAVRSHWRSRPARSWALAAIAFLLWLAPPVSAQQAANAAGQPGSISGSIRDTTGLPLANARVTLHGQPGAERSVQTGREGEFHFSDLPAGDYELTADLTGFAAGRRTVHIAPGERATTSLTLWVLILEQTVVTATKTGDADVQATPLAISAFPGAELQRLEVHTVEQLAGLAPNVTFSANTGFAQLTIRGIGSNVVFAGTDPSSAVYLDGVYIARPVAVLTDFLDLERVEVLRGPQGTLYGRNAVGGAINLISKAPTNDLEASARFVGGDNGLFRSEAKVSGPIIRDRLQGSAAILRGVREGYVNDLEHPGRPLGGEDAVSFRGQLRWVLNPRTDLLVSGDLDHQDPVPLSYPKVLAVKPGFQVNNPASLHDVRSSTPPASDTTHYGSSARLTMSLSPSITLTNLFAFRKLEYDLVNDSDITELNLVSVHLQEFQHQLSDELTLSQRGERLSWVGGVFLLQDDDRQPTRVQAAGPRLETLLSPDVDASSRALFGEATVALSARVSITAGLRYTHEEKTIDNLGQVTSLDPPNTVVPSYAYTDHISHDAWTPKVALQMLTSKQALAYISATRGFKSGGFNLTSTAAGRGYAPEWAWSYEAGYKATVADGRARLNVAGFYMDYTDLQVQTAILPGVIDISNAAAATISGVELETVWQLMPSLQAGGHLAWLDAKYDRYVAVGVGGVTGDVAGHRLSNAPAWSGRLWAQWSRNAGRAGVFSLRGDAVWQTTVYYTPFNDVVQRQRPYGWLDLTAEVAPSHRWAIGAFVRNLTNQDYITGTFSSPPPAIGGRPGDARQFGVSLTVRR